MKKIFLLLFIALLVSCKDSKEEVVGNIYKFSKLELGTVEYTVDKVVGAESRMVYKDYDISFGDRKILYSMTATLKAGINLDSFNPDKDVVINGKSITVNLPKAKLLVLNIAPESIRYEFSKVSWFRPDFTESEKNLVLKLGEKSIRDSINSIGILKDAEENTREYFESVFSTLGFENITIIFV